jgi:hypothetical protein
MDRVWLFLPLPGPDRKTGGNSMNAVVTYKIDKSAAEGGVGKYLAIPSTIGIILIDLME